MSTLVFENVSHSFGDLRAVDRLTLSVASGELVCLLGPSGCGKTTALRLAAGLERLQSGRILIGGELVADGWTQRPPEERDVGLVFQDFALFPHLRVIDNVMFGLRRTSRPARRARALEALDRVGMVDYAHAYPHTLSGGQQQRVALARALAPQPRVMLLDEPFSGLDVGLRNQVRDETMHLLRGSGTASLLVTHDPEEAMFMADRIALMRDGRLIQVGSSEDLYRAPEDPFVAGFFGEINRLQGLADRDGRIMTPFGLLDGGHRVSGRPVEILIRPEALHLQPACGAHPAEASNLGRVMACRMLGRSSLVHLSLLGEDGEEVHLHARIPGAPAFGDDRTVAVALDRSQVFIFPVEGGGIEREARGELPAAAE